MNYDSLRKLFKNKDKSFFMRVLLLFCLGAALIIVSTFPMWQSDDQMPQTPEESSEDAAMITTVPYSGTLSTGYERLLERRLGEVLSLVQGAGRVEVMLTLSQSREIILAEDVNTNESLLRETDAGGGTRENHSLSKDMRTVLVGGPGGAQEPIILREILPRVEGVIIVAEGGDDVFIREALMRAASTALGVDIHRVQVLQRKQVLD